MYDIKENTQKIYEQLVDDFINEKQRHPSDKETYLLMGIASRDAFEELATRAEYLKEGM